LGVGLGIGFGVGVEIEAVPTRWLGAGLGVSVGAVGVHPAHRRSIVKAKQNSFRFIVDLFSVWHRLLECDMGVVSK